MLWNGCLSFKKYLALKSSKFGIKTFELCDSKTGYVPLLGQGRMLWMDNYYNPPILARILKINYHTDCVGTLRLNQKMMKEKKLKKGEVFGEHSGPISVLKWIYKKIQPSKDDSCHRH
ncbi:hypothetical protein J437_LFUL017343 [Ladona fulva]|uniref:PiggyBac transposable element-derived protein domain-containing protein n=1 Tax=Ladona fulva TaxID=123851 RepID=A0A8K0KJH0_LADFU|nr:hypothetical protein J437_LFUL017343 [Ladona fulva]